MFYLFRLIFLVYLSQGPHATFFYTYSNIISTSPFSLTIQVLAIRTKKMSYRNCEVKFLSKLEATLTQSYKFDVVTSPLQRRCEFDVVISTLQKGCQYNIHCFQIRKLKQKRLNFS